LAGRFYAPDDEVLSEAQRIIHALQRWSTMHADLIRKEKAVKEKNERQLL